jgi:CyaY protein
MNESDFINKVDTTLKALELAIEQLANDTDIDVDMRREGYVLTIDFDDFGKVIINAQAAVQELWVAAKSGGFHYRLQEALWKNTRDQTELADSLSQILSLQLKQPVVVSLT